MLLPIGSMYGIYANIWGILMVNVTIYIAYMDPMGYTCYYTCVFMTNTIVVKPKKNDPIIQPASWRTAVGDSLVLGLPQ